ncbi:MAG: uracil-xanthine permease family protein [Anaerolineae bacterium]
MSSEAATRARPLGYLPKDFPPIGATIVLGLQHVLAMFPATVLVAMLTKFDVGVTLFASGLATIIALLGSGLRIPLYYGSSFSYIAAVVGIVGFYSGTAGGAAATPEALQMGIRIAQGGIVVTGSVSIIAGLIIRWIGKASLDKVLPPVITGSVAMVIGLSLAKTALDMASASWGIALLTLLVTVLFSVYLRGKGIISMMPVIFGAAAGYIVALILAPDKAAFFKPVADAAWLRVPAFTLPIFKWQAILSIAPIAIATIPESTAHLYQISLYVDELADELARPKPSIKNLIGLNLILDGIGDSINGLLGGCAGTNYGENLSLMAITRNYSSPVLIAGGIIAMLLGFIGKLAGVIGTLPLGVTGGLAIFFFGVIALQGVALMQSEKVDLFDSRQLAVGALILVVGIGGSVFPGGNLPFQAKWLSGIFTDGNPPAIATAAVMGILLNAIFLIFPPKKDLSEQKVG